MYRTLKTRFRAKKEVIQKLRNYPIGRLENYLIISNTN